MLVQAKMATCMYVTSNLEQWEWSLNRTPHAQRLAGMMSTTNANAKAELIEMLFDATAHAATSMENARMSLYVGSMTSKAYGRLPRTRARAAEESRKATGTIITPIHCSARAPPQGDHENKQKNSPQGRHGKSKRPPE